MSLNCAVKILLVEDNPGDALLAQEALSGAKVRNELAHVIDGQAALDYLASVSAKDRPDLILLDLNLLKVNGREVLERVKADPDLKMIPVVILTSSQAEQDIARSYQLNCNAYVTKPLDMKQFVAVIQSIENFWLTVVKLPPKEPV